MIELATMIKALRGDLQVAIEEAAGRARFWVVAAGEERKHGATHTRRITLSLTPCLAEGMGNAYVNGSVLAGEV